MRIAQADPSHFPALIAIELAAFETLRAAQAVTGDATASSEEALQHYLSHQLLLAAFNEDDIPVGYGAGYVVEHALHISEVDVHPNWQRQGIGRQLVHALLAAGRARQLHCATLTTDRFAPFNAPFYTALGFRLLAGDDCPPRLQQLLAAEHASGMDPQRRIAMQLLL